MADEHNEQIEQETTAGGDPGAEGGGGAPDTHPAQDAVDMLDQVAASVGAAATEAAAGAVDEAAATAATTGVTLPDFAAANGASNAEASLSLLGDVSLKVQVELGRTKMYVEDVLKLTADSVIELDKAAGDPVDIYVNGRHVARGEVLVLNENFCVRVSEIVNNPSSED